jgi:hypothetical protein
MTPKFKGTVARGLVDLIDKSGYDRYIKTLEGKEIFLTVSQWKNTRSNNQNNYYWGVVVKLLSETTGYTLQEMHEALKIKFLLKQNIVTINNETEVSLPTMKSTALMNTLEFEDYCKEIREWASADLNCFIPLPNEVDLPQA